MNRLKPMNDTIPSCKITDTYSVSLLFGEKFPPQRGIFRYGPKP